MEKKRTHKIGSLSGLVKLLQRPALCLFMLFLSFYYLTNAGWFKTGDEGSMLKVAKQIVENGQIGFHSDTLPDEKHHEDYYHKGTDGRFYYKWGLGQSLVEVPFYLLHHLVWGPYPYEKGTVSESDANRISELVLLFLCPSIISAIGCVIVFCMGRRLGYSERSSILLSLLYGLGTMVWPYAKSLSSDTTLNVAILGSVFAAVSYVKSYSKYWLAVSGACLGFAIITKAISIVVVPPIIFYAMIASRSKASRLDILLYFMPPLMAFVGFQLWHNVIRYGSFWQFGYQLGWGALGFSTPLYVGMWGLFASPGKSFFLYSPVAILGLASAWQFYRKRKPEALLFLGIIILITLPHALWCLWAGDWAWGPRFLLTITPFMILPAGTFFEQWQKKSNLRRRVTILLIIFSIVIQLLGVTIHPFSFIRARTEVINQLVKPEPSDFTYRRTYSETAFNNFSPLFSHIVGNWWLFKHLIFSYDLWSDVPWRVLGDFKPGMIWIMGNRTIPFWWPISFPLVSPSARSWVYPYATANLLFIVWWAVRLKRSVSNRAKG